MTLRDAEGHFIGSTSLGDTAYEYDHFSGSQISVMIGDVVIDSAVGIQFNRNQSKTPVYGYANQYYTFVANGKILVHGAITIAFKEAGYLLQPIKRFINMQAGGDWTSPRYVEDKQGRIAHAYDPNKSDGTFSSAAEAARRGVVKRANVEAMMEWDAAPSKYKMAKTRFNKFWHELGAMSDDKFEDWAETFEDAIWYGSDPNNPLMRDKLFAKNIRPNHEIDDEEVLSHRSADLYPPIDIWITYGDMSRHSVNHTVRKILDVSFIGQAQTIEVSGEPVYEVTHFIARNLV